MRKIKIPLLALCALLLSSCVPSVHSLFVDADRTFEPALDGVWEGKKEDQTNTFTLRWFADGKLYSLHTEMSEQPGNPGEFNAVLGTVGKHRFLEIVPRRPSNISAKGFYGGHFLQMYSFWKFDLEGDKLTLTPLNYQWVEAMSKAKRLELKHEKQDGGFIILTASTEELKAFVLKYADDKSVFSSGLTFERKK